MLFHFNPLADISGQPSLPDFPAKILLKKYFHRPAFFAGVPVLLLIYTHHVTHHHTQTNHF